MRAWLRRFPYSVYLLSFYNLMNLFTHALLNNYQLLQFIFPWWVWWSAGSYKKGTGTATFVFKQWLMGDYLLSICGVCQCSLETFVETFVCLSFSFSWGICSSWLFNSSCGNCDPRLLYENLIKRIYNYIENIGYPCFDLITNFALSV